MTEPEYLSPDDLVTLFRLPSARSLEEWRREGRGPRWVKIGRHVRYPVAEVERYRREREQAAGITEAS